jgi:hypothetical protein
MKRIDVVKKGDHWVGQTNGQTVRGTKAPQKTDAVKKAAQVAKSDSQPVTVKIHKENGRIQEERSYPSKADPHRTKG